MKFNYFNSAKNSLSLLCVSLCMLFVSCTPRDKEVIILSVNDMHASLERFPRFAYVVDSLRAIYPDLFLFSAGDIQTGSPFNDKVSPKGLPMIDLMNKVGFNASAIGNHEFDVGKQDFIIDTQAAHFAFLCANLSAPSYKGSKVKPYEIFKLPNGLKVGVWSAVQLNENNIPDTHPSKVKECTFVDYTEAFDRYKSLNDSCDLFVALTHLGYQTDLKLAKTMSKAGLDLIVGGHSHSLIKTLEKHDGVYVTQAGSKLRYTNLIKLKVSSKGVVTDCSLTQIALDEGSQEDPVIRKMVNKYKSVPQFMEVAGVATADFRGKDELGSLMSDANKAYAKADVSLQNRGGIRMNVLHKGDITVGDVLMLDPFGNNLFLLKMTGEELQAFCEGSFSIENGHFFVPSGLTLEAKVDANHQLKTLKIKVNGKRLNPKRLYKVAMSSYIALGYKLPHKDKGVNLNITTAEALIKYLQKKKKVSPIKQVRETFKED